MNLIFLLDTLQFLLLLRMNSIFSVLFFNILSIIHRKALIFSYANFVYSHHTELFTAAAAAKSLQSCLTLCDPRDDSPPGSPDPAVAVYSLSRVWLLVTPWTVACQAPLFMGFPRQEYRSGLSFPSTEDLPCLGIEPSSPARQADSSPLSHHGGYSYTFNISLLITFPTWWLGFDDLFTMVPDHCILKENFLLEYFEV